MAEIINGVIRIKIPTPYNVGDTYVYVLKEDALTMVDTGIGTDEAKEVLIEELKSLKLDMNDFDQIILTHHHPDHSGGLNYLNKNIPVQGHKNNDRWLTKSPPFLDEYLHFYEKLYTSFHVPQEQFHFIHRFRKNLKYTGSASLANYLKEGDIITGHKDWKVIETFGHATSQISLLNEKTGQLIAGDALIEHIVPIPLIEPPLEENTERPSAILEHNRTLQKLQRLPINEVLSGHGVVFHHVEEVINKSFAFQHRRAMKVLELLRKNPLTIYELCVQVFPKTYEKELMLTLSETIAQIDYLLDKGMIKTRQEGEKLIYFA